MPRPTQSSFNIYSDDDCGTPESLAKGIELPRTTAQKGTGEDAVHKRSPGPQLLNIILQLPHDTSATIEVPNDSLVYDLRAIIEQHEGIPKVKQQMIYKGQVLAGVDSLAFAGIAEGDTIDVQVVDNAEHVDVSVIDLPHTVYYRCNPYTPLEVLMSTFCLRQDIERHEIAFYTQTHDLHGVHYPQRRVRSSDTVESLRISHGGQFVTARLHACDTPRMTKAQFNGDVIARTTEVHSYD